MSIRTRWSLSQAASSVATWSVAMVVLSLISYNEKPMHQIASCILLLLIIPPLLYRWRQFYQMFPIQELHSADAQYSIRIGHQQAFSNILLQGRSNNTWNEFVLFLDNGILVTAKDKSDLVAYQNIIAQHPTYRQYLVLLVNCQVMDARDPARELMPDFL